MSRIWLLIIGGWLLFLMAACTPAPQYSDYYVSVLGSNTTGNGTQSKPWRHIQYALDHANYSGIGDTVRIHLAKGIYNENIVIDEDVIIIGAGVSEVVSTQAGSPEIPNQTVSVIARQSYGKTVVVNGAEAELKDLNVYGGAITASNADLSMRNVLVNGVTGFYGVLVNHSSFSILDSKIVTQPNNFSDVGLLVFASAGFFTNSYVGPRFDHAISIEPWSCYEQLQSEGICTGEETVNPYNLPAPLNIYITGATVEGSSIYYADGIRIQGAANVVIKNSNITRSNGEGANTGSDHNRPYAAIEVAGYLVGQDNKMRRVEIIGTSMSGFDVGIGVDIASLELKVEGSSINALTHGVETNYFAYSGTTLPTVDFGGGQLGSKGNNTFSNLPKYAYFHDTGPYDVWACNNTWQVIISQIDPLRIYDKLDKSSLGRVQWDCSGTGSSSQGLTVVTPTNTLIPEILQLVAIPKENANCRLGNSASMFKIVDTMYSRQRYLPVGIGPDRLWVAFIGPVYGARCWVFADSLIFLLGDEEIEPQDIPPTYLPVLSYPPMPTATYTPKPREPRPTQNTTTTPE